MQDGKEGIEYIVRKGGKKCEKDGFPFPDQVEDRFHGNDRGKHRNDRGRGEIVGGFIRGEYLFLNVI